MDIVGFLFVMVVSGVSVDGHGRALSECRAPGLDFQITLNPDTYKREVSEALFQI